MFIRLKDLEVRNLDFLEAFPPGAINLGEDVRQVGTLEAKGRAEIVREHEGRQVVEDIRLVGSFSGTVEASCARCLEPVEHKVSQSFDLLYRQLEPVRGDDVSISRAETEIGYFSGDGIELEDSLREQILLQVPLKTVCREDCKGLCPQCGKNRNLESCDCENTQMDARWSALRELKKDLR